MGNSCMDEEKVEIKETKDVSVKPIDKPNAKKRNVSDILIKPNNNRFSSLKHGFNLRFLDNYTNSLKQVYVCESIMECKAVLKLLLKDINDNKIPRITIRGGGHCYEGFVQIGTDAIIDISCMKKCEKINLKNYSKNIPIISIEAGITNWEGTKYLFKEYGYCLPGGSCYSVGFGGHISGGGYGLLSRKYGLTVDYLIGVELVYYDASKKQVQCKQFVENSTDIIYDDDNNNEEDEKKSIITDDEVVWAHKGCGGGNYGIITKYIFRDLPKAPSRVLLCQRKWSWKVLRGKKYEYGKKDKWGFEYDYIPFRHLLKTFGDFWVKHVNYRNGVKQSIESESDGLDYNNMFSIINIFTDTPGADEVNIIVQWAIDESDTDISNERQAVEQFYKDISAKIPKGTVETAKKPDGHPYWIADTTDVVEYSWLTATMNLNASGPSRCGKYKSAYMMESFTEHEINTIIRFCTMEDKRGLIKNGLVEIDSYGGMINSKTSDSAAIPQRSSVMKLQYQVYWTLQQESERIDEIKQDIIDDIKISVYCIKWINNFYHCMYKSFKDCEPFPDNKHVEGCYVNYCDIDLINWQYCYYQKNYSRLQSVKRYLDKKQIFWHRQSIRTDEMEDKSKSLPWPRDAPRKWIYDENNDNTKYDDDNKDKYDDNYNDKKQEKSSNRAQALTEKKDYESAINKTKQDTKDETKSSGDNDNGIDIEYGDDGVTIITKSNGITVNEHGQKRYDDKLIQDEVLDDILLT